MKEGADLRLTDFGIRKDGLLHEVIEGLTRPRKELPPKYFYDERGSELFERICELDEYYLTRTELAILERHAFTMARLLGRRLCLVEYGSGSSLKTRILLDHLDDPVAYVPVDISREHLLRSAADLSEVYPHLAVLPVCADYTRDFELPEPDVTPARVAIYFPGSTVGNLHPPEAEVFLKRQAAICGPGGALLIGVDLEKDVRTLEAAYDDSQGVTAEFNRNILARIDRELGADFDLSAFHHRAFYNREEGRIEMHLVSVRKQSVRVGRVRIPFEKGESILTECSYKYDLGRFRRLARGSGWTVERVWMDDERLFSIQYLTPAASLQRPASSPESPPRAEQ